MAKVFDYNKGQIEVRPEVMMVSEFKALWDRDKDQLKTKAYKELFYVYCMCDYSSPYNGYSPYEKEGRVKQDCFKDDKYVIDKPIKDAMAKYIKLTETTNLRLLRSARSAAEKLGVYFDLVNFDELDSQGRPLYNAKDLADNLKKVGDIVDSLSKLEVQVKKEQLESSVIRGGGSVGDYEVE